MHRKSAGELAYQARKSYVSDMSLAVDIEAHIANRSKYVSHAHCLPNQRLSKASAVTVGIASLF